MAEKHSQEAQYLTHMVFQTMQEAAFLILFEQGV